MSFKIQEESSQTSKREHPRKGGKATKRTSKRTSPQPGPSGQTQRVVRGRVPSNDDENNSDEEPEDNSDDEPEDNSDDEPESSDNIPPAQTTLVPRQQRAVVHRRRKPGAKAIMEIRQYQKSTVSVLKITYNSALLTMDCHLLLGWIFWWLV